MASSTLPLSTEVCARCAPEPGLRAVVFNRVPKCGSTTLEHIIRNQSRRCGFQFRRSHDYVNCSISEGEQRRFARLITDLASRRRVLYDRHLHFVDFAQLGSNSLRPVYINMLREPLSMQVSAFYFWRDCICRTHKPFCRAAWQPSNSSPLCSTGVDAVYASVEPQPAVGTITRYFCGQAAVCKVADPAPAAARRAALARALHNLRHRYLWVGVLERLADSLQLLTLQLPSFFGGLDVAAASRAHVRPVDSSAYPPAQPETLSKLARESANDLTVYRHALQLLECRLLHCASSADGGASGRGGRCARTRARGAARLQQAARRGGRGATAARNSAAARLLGGGEYNGESWLAA